MQLLDLKYYMQNHSGFLLQCVLGIWTILSYV